MGLPHFELSIGATPKKDYAVKELDSIKVKKGDDGKKQAIEADQRRFMKSEIEALNREVGQLKTSKELDEKKY